MTQCSNCRYFKPLYFQVGRCQRQVEGSNAKMFTEDGKSAILVHITFSCSQHEEHLAVSKEVI